MKVRSENRTDFEAVAQVVTAAFGARGEADLVAALRATVEPYVSLVAERDGEVVGHVFVSPVTLERSDEEVAWGGLAPVAVTPACQNCGIGSALMRAALDESRKLGWQAVFLLGDPLYYRRFGFELAAPKGFHYASYEFDSAFQSIELMPGALEGRSGWILYPPAFDALGEG